MIGEKEYPYVMVRYAAATYGRHQVRFVEDYRQSVPDQDRVFVVFCPKPFSEGRLTPDAGRALIEMVQEASRSSLFRMCAVLGENSCVYCEPDGKAKGSFEPPSGGIPGMKFPVRFT